MRELARLDFGNQIVLFGAALLLSVLPLIILLSALASTRVDDDIARHLGLSGRGTLVIERLFNGSGTGFGLGVLISLLLGLVGTLAVAGLVQTIYERAFDQPHRRSARNVLRCLVWVGCVAALMIAEAAVGKTLRDGPAGPVVVAVVELVVLTLFFWWAMTFLLAGRVSWGSTFPAAVATAIFWIGLGFFASFYFSSTIVSDSRLYGAIGVVFTLVTWFIAAGAVITLGAAVGVVWQARRSLRSGGAGERRATDAESGDGSHEPD